MWVFVARIILRNRLPVLILIGFSVLFMANNARKAELSFEYATLLPETDSIRIKYEAFKEQFGEDGNVLLIGISDTALFQLDKFNSWYDLGNKIRDIDGVEEVVSIARIYNITKNDTVKKFDFVPVIQQVLGNQHQLDSIKKVIDGLKFYEGIFNNPETGANMMLVTLDKEKNNSKERIRIVDQIQEYSELAAVSYNWDLHYSGLPFIRTAVSEKVKAELNKFLLLAILITALLLFMFFRSLVITLFSLLVVCIAVVFTLGTITLLGYKITILTGLIPPIIIVIGIPNCIFLLNKYHAEYRIHGNKIKALSRMIQKIGNATLLTNATTASGFATFVITKSAILKEFGAVASLNIMGVFILSLLLIPAIFSYLPVPKLKQTKHLENKWINSLLARLSTIVQYHRKSVYIVTGIAVILALVGISKIRSTGFMVDDIPKNDPIYVDLMFFQDNFNGVMPFEISIDTKKKKGVMKLKVLKKIEKLQEMLKEYPVFSRSLSVVDLVKFSKQAVYNGNPEKYGMPNKRDQTYIAKYAKGALTGNNNLRSFIDSNKRYTRVSAQLADVGTIEMQKLTKTLEARIDSIFDPAKFNVEITGTSVVYHKGTEYLVNNLFISLGLAVCLIGIFMAMLFSSIRMIIVSLIPNIIPLLITAALMGYFNITIKPSTILIFSIAFGISVDDTIHFLAKYRQELAGDSTNIGVAVLRALKETGLSMVYTSVVLFFGFGIFAVSNFGGTVALGILVSITLFVAMFANLVLLPSLLLSLERAIITKSFREPLIQILNEEEDIELDKLEIKKEK